MPAERKIEVTSIPLHNLVAAVETGHFRIPRFQREYVWERPKITELFDSIYREYPIGSFFLWKAGRDMSHLFRQSPELGVPPARDEDDVSFILDGQQRITSLYVTLRGMTIGGIDYSNICFDLLEQRFVVRQAESRARYIPVSEIWQTSIVRLSKELDDSLLEPLERLDSVLKSYPVSVVEVKDKSLSDVCGIFQRINQSGKRLDRFDLVSAMTFSPDFDLRERFNEDINGQLREKGFGEIEPTIVTQLLALLTKGYCTESYEYSLTAADVMRAWTQSVNGILLAADLLRKNMGVMQAQYLPYDALFTLVAYFFAAGQIRSPTTAQLGWIKRWFWRSSFGLRYASAVATQIGRDRELFDELMTGDVPEFAQHVELTPDLLVRTKMTSTRGAIRNGFLCLLASKKPVDLANNAELDVTSLSLSSFTDKQKHHIFPWAFLKRQQQTASQVHSLPNFCFLTADLNRRISDAAPSVYFADLRRANANLEAALARSLIPSPESSGILEDDYLRFKEARAHLLLQEIGRLTGQIAAPTEDERHRRIVAIENGLRDLIDSTLREVIGPDYWKQSIHKDVRTKANERVEHERRRLPDAFENRVVTPRVLLDFLNPGEYISIVDANWKRFAGVFGTRESFLHHMVRFNDFRNRVMHNRQVSPVGRAEGEAAIVWLESVLPTVEDPATSLEAELSEDDQDDAPGSEEVDSAATDREYWEKKLSPAVLRSLDKLIAIVRGLGADIEPIYRVNYVGQKIGGVPDNFALFSPKRSWVRCGLRLPYSKEVVGALERAGFETMSYNQDSGRIRFKIREIELDANESLLINLLRRAYEAGSSARSISHDRATRKDPRLRWESADLRRAFSKLEDREQAYVYTTILDWAEASGTWLRSKAKRAAFGVGRAKGRRVLSVYETDGVWVQVDRATFEGGEANRQNFIDRLVVSGLLKKDFNPAMQEQGKIIGLTRESVSHLLQILKDALQTD